MSANLPDGSASAVGSKTSRVDKILGVVACVALAAAIVSLTWLHYSRQPHPVYAVGDRVVDLPEIDFSAAKQTVVIWLNTQCEPCAESMPFYREVASKAQGTRLVAVSPQSAEELRDFLTFGGVKTHQQLSIGMRSVRLWTTPAMLVVGRDGRVKWVSVGKLEKRDAEEAVLGLVGQPQ